MRTRLGVLLLLAFAAISGKMGQSAAEDSDDNSAARIEELRKKLESLHAVLNELSHNIEEFDEQLEAQEGKQEEKKDVAADPPAVEEQDQLLEEFEAQLSPEDLELLQKMHSKVKFLQTALHEPDTGPNPGEENQEVEPVEEETEPAKRQQAAGIDELLSQLSPEDQELVRKHPSAAAHLQKAMEEQKEGDHNGQEEAEPQEPAKREQDPSLDEFIGQLTPEQQQLIQKHPSMVAHLKQALQEQKEGNHNGGEEAEEDTSVRKKEKTESVDDMLSNLSPADQELVQKNPSMLQHLQQALLEQQQGNHNGPEEADQTPPERRVGDDIGNFMRELSDEDQKLIESHPSVWEKLQAALQEDGQNEEEPNADEEEAAEEDRKRGEAAENELQDFVNGLSPEDKELLKEMKSQLEKVKDAIEEYHENKRRDQDDEHTEDDEDRKPQDDEGGAAEDDEGAPSEDDGNKRSNEDYHHPPIKPLKQSASQGSFGAIVAAETEKREFDSNWSDKPAQDKDLGALTDVKQRFLDDVTYAKTRGVDLKELLRVLSARKARGVTDEERELEMLRNH